MRGRVRFTLLAIGVVAVGSGCMVGPDYRRPEAPLAERWRGGRDGEMPPAADLARWWQVFRDPTLEGLVDEAIQANLSLQAAGLRVLAAQARRGIAVGNLFPQRQAIAGAATRSHLSRNATNPAIPINVESYQLGFDAAWEIDLWGRFRRAIEASDADLLASVADRDDVLVSLIAEVAATYVRIRVLEERRALAADNVRTQRQSLELADIRYRAGGTSELDLQQATTLVENTEAIIPVLDTQRTQAENALGVLLGRPPSDMDATLAQTARGIPAAPSLVTVGIPADLLRRRPDVRRAERQLAAQSARIGVAKADLFPSLSLAGSVSLRAQDAAKLIEGRSFEGIGGPQLDWPVLNYGRLVNAVRVQDATFQALAAAYEETVLRAQRDVEDALAGYFLGREQVQHLEHSAAAAARAVELSLIQYREGAADYTRVLTAQQSKLLADDALASARGNVTASVVSLYRSLGGGWDPEGRDLVPTEVKQEMRARTWWGRMLDEDPR